MNGQRLRRLFNTCDWHWVIDLSNIRSASYARVSWGRESHLRSLVNSLPRCCIYPLFINPHNAVVAYMIDTTVWVLATRWILLFLRPRVLRSRRAKVDEVQTPSTWDIWSDVVSLEFSTTPKTLNVDTFWATSVKNCSDSILALSVDNDGLSLWRTDSRVGAFCPLLDVV